MVVTAVENLVNAKHLKPSRLNSSFSGIQDGNNPAQFLAYVDLLVCKLTGSLGINVDRDTYRFGTELKSPCGLENS